MDKNWGNFVERVSALNGGMLCKTRLRMIGDLLDDVVSEGIPGDCVEVGCNRGFTAALMQAVLSLSEGDRALHVFDSFQGLSELDAEDAGCRLKAGRLATSRESLLATFQSLELVSPAIHAGWLEDTVVELPARIAFAHVDVDLYKPTYLALCEIYPRLTRRGVLIVDDFAPPDALNLDQGFPGVWRACQEWMRQNEVIEPFELHLGDEFCSGIRSSHAVLIKL